MERTFKPGILGNRLRNLMDSLDMPYALGLSGGIDSSFLLYLSGSNCKAYTAGIENCRDIHSARNVAEFY
ncbi:MAG: asparagine synthase-related protein [Thermoplasmataceae archaeon]